MKAAAAAQTNTVIGNSSYELLLQKRLELLQRFEGHLKRADELRDRFQAIDDELQRKPQMKLAEIDHLKARVEQYTSDLRALQTDSSALDRLLEESNTTLTDSNTNRTVFFTVESRSIQSLVDMIENRVSRPYCPRREPLQSAHCLPLHHGEASKKLTAAVQRTEGYNRQAKPYEYHLWYLNKIFCCHTS